MTEGLTLAEIAREIPGEAVLVGDASVRARGVRHDSREVERGDLFVARKGASSDGAAFVKDALARGAVGVLAKKGTIEPASVGAPVILVDDIADGLAWASAAVYGHPAFGLEIVGVTGTNGKTTTTHLVRAAIDAAVGAPACATLGTVGHFFAGKAIPAAHTTPEADELARLLAAMRRSGATYAAMEVSSHALALGRVRAVRFRVAAFTNLTQDHLDFHGSMEAYANAKRMLFVDCEPGAAVINVDDTFGGVLHAAARAPVVRVSCRPNADADVFPRDVRWDARGMSIELATPAGDVLVRTRLVGAHNLQNVAIAMAVAHSLELDLERAAAGIAEEPGAPGRMERCDGPGDDLTVLVDYAHTPDALARVLASLRTVSPARLWCIFGCGGDRDPTKRAPMGEAAARGADAVVVTSDNPRTEDPAAIARAAEDGVRAAGLSATSIDRLAAGDRGYALELDRRAAIEKVIAKAAPGDVVLVAGKGHEDYQIIGTEKRRFDDREECRRALASRRGAS
jgi:UDP-N-acetylmuramoyl-L-alanyl-D-glutamate--2,6-diaminopimelate ligase